MPTLAKQTFLCLIRRPSAVRTRAGYLGELVREGADDSDGSGWRMRTDSTPTEKPLLLRSLESASSHLEVPRPREKQSSERPLLRKLCIIVKISVSGEINVVQCYLAGPLRKAIFKTQLSWCGQVQCNNSESTALCNTEHWCLFGILYPNAAFCRHHLVGWPTFDASAWQLPHPLSPSQQCKPLVPSPL